MVERHLHAPWRVNKLSPGSWRLEVFDQKAGTWKTWSNFDDELNCRRVHEVALYAWSQGRAGVGLEMGSPLDQMQRLGQKYDQDSGDDS